MKAAKNNLILYTAAFLIPIAILLIIFVIERFAPFGDKSLLIMDMSNQYIEFLNGLKNGDIGFSWSKSLGTNYIGVFAYYLSSPFSLLTLLFSNENMPYCVILLTFLKIGCAGITSRLYFKNKFSVDGIGNLIFSTAYSLMSYNLAYSMCIMWLDGVIWLPIILYAIEHILNGKSGYLLCISLLISLLSNYYISFMLILYATLYFAARCFEEKIDFRAFTKYSVTYVANVFFPVGLGACFFLPTFLSHFEGKLISAQVDYSEFFTCELSDIIGKILCGGYDSITNSGTPYVFCGILIAVLAFAFFSQGQVPIRSKLCHGGLLILLSISMWISALDKVWHVFQYPNWFPYRYSFLLSFTLIATACRTFSMMKVQKRQGVILFLLLLTIVDLGWNGITIVRGLNSQFGFESMSEYTEFKKKKEALLAQTPTDSEFFRVRSTAATDRSKNDAIGFGYNGITHYSSSYCASVNSWCSNFGLAQNWFWCSDYGSTPITDLFLDVEYVISPYSPGNCYECISENNFGNLYKSAFNGAIAYFTNTTNSPLEYSINPFDNQNNLFNYLTASQSMVFCEMDNLIYTDDSVTIIDIVSNGEPLYGYFGKQNDVAALYINDNFTSWLFTENSDCIQYLGTFPEGEKVTLSIATPLQYYSLCYFDTKTFFAGVEKLEQNNLQHMQIEKDGKCELGIVCTHSGYIVTSIPASDGWAVYVDGIYSTFEVLYDTFIVVPITEGEHIVSMMYIPPGLRLGAFISCISLLLCFTFLYPLTRLSHPDRDANAL